MEIKFILLKLVSCFLFLPHWPPSTLSSHSHSGFILISFRSTVSITRCSNHPWMSKKTRLSSSFLLKTSAIRTAECVLFGSTVSALGLSWYGWDYYSADSVPAQTWISPKQINTHWIYFSKRVIAKVWCHLVSAKSVISWVGSVG